MRRCAAVLIASVMAVLLPASASAATRVPQGFAGAMIDGPVLGRYVDLGRQMDKMVASGVESVRVVFSWADAQPYPDWSSVPSSKYSHFENVSTDVPTNFSAMDRVVAAAAAHGLRVLPVVINTPGWDADDIGRRKEPRRTGPYADFLTVLAQRYGPTGTFWYEHPDTVPDPIRMWQIWNEPNGYYYWDQHPFAPSYVSLLRAARTAIRQVDPRGQIVLAGFPNRSWESVREVYQVRGARGLFDVVAVHPYTAQASGVITILQRVRAVMNSFGDRGKPLMATETGWPASQGLGHPNLSFATTPSGQAQRIGQLIPLLAADRGALNLAGFDLYTWMGTEHKGNYAFDFSGLVSFGTYTHRIADKPALSAFRRAVLPLEGCKVKASVATSCARS